jgi:phospholipase C
MRVFVGRTGRTVLWAATGLGLALGLSAQTRAGIPQISHVVIVIQENRSVDNLFHGLNQYLPLADVADSGVDSKGKVIKLGPVPLKVNYDLDHSHLAFTSMYDGGKMDGADLVKCYPNFGPCPANASFQYVQHADVEPYFEIARNYGFANRMFQSNQGPSFPAHQFLFGGTSQPEAYSPLFAADNTFFGAGCIAPTKAYVDVIDPSGSTNAKTYPCFEHQTLADLLDAPPKNPGHPISWRYYTIGAQSIWSAPDAIGHLCQPAGSPPSCTNPHWTDGDIVFWPPQVLNDIEHRALKSVSWVIPTGQDSDHPLGSDGSGPSWVASIVNAIGGSPYWNNTVILILWDDWGGWYDHVKPPIDSTYGYYEYGFRVPLLVVSPYTPKGHVSQKQHDFGSILRFVETVFDLGRIPPGDFVDARADDLGDFFDFSKPPRPFTHITQPVPSSHFRDPSRKMTPPDDD